MRRKLAYVLVESSRFTTYKDLEEVMRFLNESLNSCRQDPNNLECLQIELITFGAKPFIERAMISVCEYSVPKTIQPGYGCNLGRALVFLKSRILKERRVATSSQKGDWNPDVIIISSGNSDDVIFSSSQNPQLTSIGNTTILRIRNNTDNEICLNFEDDIFNVLGKSAPSSYIDSDFGFGQDREIEQSRRCLYLYEIRDVYPTLSHLYNAPIIS